MSYVNFCHPVWVKSPARGPEHKLRPGLHDLRFYFANQVLTNSPNDHDGIVRRMITLTTYLGHREVRNRYWYLEATPALFTKIAARCEAFAKGEHS